MARIIGDMQSSPYAYQFTSNSPTAFLVHEALPLQLLEIVNRGAPRLDGQVRLRRTVHDQMTIGDLAQSRGRFAVPSMAIEGNRFVIHFGESLHLSSPFCSPNFDE